MGDGQLCVLESSSCHVENGLERGHPGGVARPDVRLIGTQMAVVEEQASGQTPPLPGRISVAVHLRGIERRSWSGWERREVTG